MRVTVMLSSRGLYIIRVGLRGNPISYKLFRRLYSITTPTLDSQQRES